MFAHGPMTIRVGGPGKQTHGAKLGDGVGEMMRWMICGAHHMRLEEKKKGMGLRWVSVHPALLPFPSASFNIAALHHVVCCFGSPNPSPQITTLFFLFLCRTTRSLLFCCACLLHRFQTEGYTERQCAEVRYTSAASNRRDNIMTRFLGKLSLHPTLPPSTRSYSDSFLHLSLPKKRKLKLLLLSFSSFFFFVDLFFDLLFCSPLPHSLHLLSVPEFLPSFSSQ